MDTVIYCFARAAVALLQALPLNWVARMGRTGGTLVFWLDARHRKVVLDNLNLCFAREMSPPEIRRLARENFRSIGENFACAIKTAVMSPEALRRHVELIGLENILPRKGDSGPHSRVVALGHFGNFELYARVSQFVPIFKCATTYRALKQSALNRILVELREHSDCRYFERRRDGAELKAAMNDTDLLLGLLADQSSQGVRVPFLGHDCNTSTATAVFALRYHWPLHPSICYRVGLAKWRLEFGSEIPTRENGHARPIADIMRDVNQAFEVGVRRDPANWFWVHRRWKD